MKTSILPKHAYRTITLMIPEETYYLYKDQSPIAEEAITQRVIDLADHTAKKPLCLTDEQRQTLNHLFNTNLNTTEDLMLKVRQLCSVKVNGVDAPLDIRLLTRLKSRCFTANFESWLATLIKQELERFAGMR